MRFRQSSEKTATVAFWPEPSFLHLSLLPRSPLVHSSKANEVQLTNRSRQRGHTKTNSFLFRWEAGCRRDLGVCGGGELSGVRLNVVYLSVSVRNWSMMGKLIPGKKHNYHNVQISGAIISLWPSSLFSLHYCGARVMFGQDNGVNINNITANFCGAAACVCVCVCARGRACTRVRLKAFEQLSTGSALNCCRPIKSCLSCYRGYKRVSRWSEWRERLKWPITGGGGSRPLQDNTGRKEREREREEPWREEESNGWKKMEKIEWWKNEERTNTTKKIKETKRENKKY